MQKLKVTVGMYLVFATLFSGIMTGCVTSAPVAAEKKNCVEQKAQVGSRLARTTCKPEEAASSAQTKAALPAP